MTFFEPTDSSQGKFTTSSGRPCSRRVPPVRLRYRVPYHQQPFKVFFHSMPAMPPHHLRQQSPTGRRRLETRPRRQAIRVRSRSPTPSIRREERTAHLATPGTINRTDTPILLRNIDCEQSARLPPTLIMYALPLNIVTPGNYPNENLG